MLGIDLVHIPRAEDLLDNNRADQFLTRSESPDTAESFAGIIAAKEAYFKAVGEKLDWKAVEIAHDEKGKPYIATDDDAQVSITHEDTYAAAVVILQ